MNNTFLVWHAFVHQLCYEINAGYFGTTSFIDHVSMMWQSCQSVVFVVGMTIENTINVENKP